MIDRFPFSVVIEDEKLMGKLWKQLSLPQQVVLKVFYGLPLIKAEEKAVWAILNDECEYDELGYVTSIRPVAYKPKEYSKLIGLMGRRSGKSSHISCFAALYEIMFGGHMAYVEKGQKVIVPYFATDMPTAKENMNHIRILGNKSPMIAKQIEIDGPADEINFKNGITVEARAANVKAGRGWPIPVAIFDEAGFWYTKSESANPDYEVERAIRPSMTQFEPFAKLFIISTPYIEDGMLWDYWNAGTDGHKLVEDDRSEYQDALVVWSTTAAMQNPVINLDRTGKPTRMKLQKIQREDPEAYLREYLARFTKAIGGLIPPELIDRAIIKGRKENEKKKIEAEGLLPFYVATMDPATRHDSWAFTIGHRDNHGKVIQDVLKIWTPEQKKYLNPDEIMSEIATVCRAWGIFNIITDQHQFETLEQLGLMKGISLQRLVFSQQSKLSIYGSLLHLLREDSIELLDVPIIRQQLAQLQRKYTALNQVQISAPSGKHDDVAVVVALLAKVALQMVPSVVVEKKPMSHLERVLARKQELQREMEFGEQWQ